MSNWWNADRLFTDAEKLGQQCRLLEPYLVSVIQTLSGVEIAQRETTRLAGFWLLHFVHRVHGVAQELADGGKLSISYKSERKVLPIPHDRREEMNATIGDLEFRETTRQLIGNVLQSGSIPQDVEILKRSSKVTKINPSDFIKSGIESIAQPLTRGARIWISQPYLKLPPSAMIASQFKSRKWANWVPVRLAFDPAAIEICANIRIELARSVQGSDFFAHLKRLLPLMLPYGYAEGWSHHKESLKCQYSSPPRVLHTAIGLQIDLWHQVASSVWGEMGTLITCHQHGGHTGIDERHVLEDLEISCSDRYYTFGWTDERSVVKPLPIPNPRKAHRTTASRILVMSLTPVDYTYRLQPFVVPPHGGMCRLETLNFFRSINKSERVVVRCCAEDRQPLRLKEFNVDWEAMTGSGTKSASRSKLVVHNYFGMSWLETLAMNVPTVCFVPPEIHRFRAAAQPFVDALARVGIIHYSGREAARFVNSLRGDPSAWWKSAEVQEARVAFVARYANFSDDWLDAWEDEFESLLAG